MSSFSCICQGEFARVFLRFIMHHDSRICFCPENEKTLAKNIKV